MTEFGDIRDFLNVEWEETRLIWWCPDVRIQSVTGRNEQDVDKHLGKQDNVIPGVSCY